MLIPKRFGHLLFGALLSGIMVSVVCACVLLVNQGLQADFFSKWLKAFFSTWPIAFPTVLVVAPMVRRLVGMLTYEPEARVTRQSSE